MKKPLDIGALIDEKLKTKSNKFGWAELLEEIDSVLMEQGPYSSKLVPGNIENLEENPRDPGNAKQIAHHAGISGNPRNPISNADMGFIAADKLAEAEQTKKMEPITVTVPDLFSLVSNQSMGLDSPEREMINDIVANFKKGNWINKVKELQRFINETSDPKRLQYNSSMRTVISALMYLSLLKKISFFIAQPGKIFEYIIAPLIGADAKVIGSTDQQILDIKREHKGYGYSVKFFTGATSEFVVKGSFKSLEDSTRDEPDKPITYIIVTSNVEERTMDFAELNVTNLKSYFDDRGAKLIKEYIDGQLYQIGESTYGLLIRNKEESSAEREKRKAEKAARLLSPKPSPPPKAPKQPAVTLKNDEIVDFDGQKFRYDILKDISQKLTNHFSRLSGDGPAFKAELLKRLNNIKITANFPQNLKDKLTSFNNTAQLKEFIKNYNTGIENAVKLAIQQKIASTQQPQVQTEAFESSELDELLLEIEGATEQAQADQEFEEVPKKAETYEFKIPLKGAWKQISKVNLTFSDVKTYNQFSLQLCTELQASMANTLNAFSQLGTNLTKYLGTSRPGEGQKENYAQLCIDNTVVIEENIMNIAGKEGDKITKKK